MDVNEIIYAANVATRGGKNKPAMIVEAEKLKPLIESIDPHSCEDQYHVWRKLVILRTKFMVNSGHAREALVYLDSISKQDSRLNTDIFFVTHCAHVLLKSGQAAAAAIYLADHVQPNGLCANHAASHNVYVKALIASSQADKAGAWMAPLLQEGGLLQHDMEALKLFAKAQGKKLHSGLETLPILPEEIETETLQGLSEAELRTFHLVRTKHEVNHDPAAAIVRLQPLIQEGGLLAETPTAHILYVDALQKQRRFLDIIEHLAPLIASGGLLVGSDHLRNAHFLYTNVLQNERQFSEVIDYLSPLVSTGALLRTHAGANLTYVKALFSTGRTASVAAHLSPIIHDDEPAASNYDLHLAYIKSLRRVRDYDLAFARLTEVAKRFPTKISESTSYFAEQAMNALDRNQPHLSYQWLDQLETLSTSPFNIYLRCKALNMEGKKSKALEVGIDFIRKSNRDSQRDYTLGVGILLSFFDAEIDPIRQIVNDLAARYGEQELRAAQKMAEEWKQNNDVFSTTTSEDFYGTSGTPSARIAEGGFRPVSRGERLKAGLPASIYFDDLEM